ncbi:hypothetical protein K504DRAFT_380404 [Pleomassaria siparia CBS 279.74]|uniref:Uncharacterized protein n=1 Tax=Pleomassaria siparia CBS 279.74 TaxID=1314801 RepID=A0A6G1K7C9_9PLEO|nr:hypothetical protein K504DRAFT_380404 [Pleomassaria siparia CBS 279.74]
MGRWQPYLYSAPQRESFMDVPQQFNPKAITIASRQPPPPSPTKKAQGPLMNFNQHPDGYLVLPYGKTDAKPMNPKTEVMIKTARWIQLSFRVVTLLGAVGVLLCGIFIKGTQATEGYVMRIAPGVDLVTNLYAIYHLLRAAKSRPAGSSASYHFFALVTDAGLIPFYVFITLLAKRNSDMKAGTDGRWRTFFPTDDEADKVLETEWLTATAVAGLHIISLVLDLYLVLIFRKIARLPPDMNPLEDNLTSRRKTKHKYKNSSMSAMSAMSAMQPLTADDKRFSAQSGATTMIESRNSRMDPLMAGKDIPAPDESKLAFMHTRNKSDTVYSPHTPRSAHQSRQALYSQSGSAAQSRRDLHTRDDLHRKDDADEHETLAQRKAFLAQKAIKRSSRPNSMVSSKQNFYTPPSTADDQDASGDLSLHNSHSDNWFVYDKDAGPPLHRKDYSVAKQLFSKSPSKGYNSVAMSEDVFSDDDELEPPIMPQPLRMNPPTPLRMNPPTPPPGKSFRKTPPPPLQRPVTSTSMSTTSTYSQSPSRTGTPKTRYYGDLKAATQGVKSGGFSASNSPSTSPTKPSTPNHLPSSARQYTTNSPSAAKNSYKSYTSIKRTGEIAYTPVKDHSPRVVSRSGVDYQGSGSNNNNYDYDDVSDLGSGRRDVSGKIAEEGRGGVANLAGRWGGMKGNGGLTYRKISGVA